MRSKRGIAPLVVVLGLAVVAVTGLFVARPKILHGETRRAASSAQATEKLADATRAQSASAAADVVVMSRTIAALPESAEKRHLEAETPVVLSKLPAPDPKELLEAEKRRAAVMQGRAEEAERLYAAAMRRADDLERQKSAAENLRRLADARLSAAAAAHRAEQRQASLALLAAAAAGVLWLYVKLTHFSPAQIASAVADMRAGVHPIQAVDTVASRIQQSAVRLLARLRQDPDRPTNPPPAA